MSKCKKEQCSSSKYQNDEQVWLHSGELVRRLVHALPACLGVSWQRSDPPQLSDPEPQVKES